MMKNEQGIAKNKEAWDSWVEPHVNSELYDVPAFIAGKCSLKALELDELGDVAGKTLLHLQCHFGKDSISWAWRGALVTGVDFSPKAIENAERLARETKTDCRFLCSNIYDLPGNLGGEFDIVYTSFGVLCWLPDLDKWAKVVAHFLKPGGTFYIAEFHPGMCMFSNLPDVTRWEIGWPYFNSGEAVVTVNEGSYAAADAGTNETHEWPHSLGEVVTSLLDAGLTITMLHEHDFSVWQFSHLLRQCDDGNFRPEDPMLSIPLMYSIKATK